MAAPTSQDPFDVATEATRGLRGLSTELTKRVPLLLEAMRSVGTGLDLRTVLDRIAETTAELVGARCAAIAVVEPQGRGRGRSQSRGRGSPHGPGGPSAASRRAGRGPAYFITYGVTGEERRRLRMALADLPVGLFTGEPEQSGLGRRSHGSFLGVPIRVGEEVFGILYLAGKRGGGEFSDSDLHLVKVLATEAGIAIGNARLYEATRQRERWIDGSVALTTSLLSGDAEDALVVVAEKARQLAGATAGIVLLPEENGGLEMVAVDADDPSGLLGTVVAPDSPVVGPLLAGEPVFVDDSATDPRMTVAVSERYGPSMMLPLISGERVLGVLTTPRKRGDRLFTDAERRLATQFAAQAAVALVLAEAQRDRERLAVYQDRDRIARDLHDLVIQRLFATGMMLESAQRQSESPEVRGQIGQAAEELDATIQEVRTAIFALQQGPAEAPSGLRARVLREVGTAAVPLGFQPSVTFLGPVDARVSELTGKNLIAALREALSNAIRHARASRIEIVVDATVRLPGGEEGVRLRVADDGVGVPAGEGRRSGLRNLARRAQALGGSSTYGPGPEPHGEGRPGTTVVWEAPL